MFAVKKVRKDEYGHLVSQAGRVKVFVSTAKGWAVVDENDVPVCHLSKTTGKLIFEVFSQKGIAQQQADWMNENNTYELLEVQRMF